MEGPNDAFPQVLDDGLTFFGQPSELSCENFYYFANQHNGNFPTFGLADTEMQAEINSYPHLAVEGTVNSDAAAIEFQVIVKRRGVLIVDLVFGSDEFPSYNATVVNDFPMIIVQRIDQPQPSVNLIKFTKQVGTNAPTVRPLTLDDIDRCPTTFFKQNRPEPATYQQ
ncbi:MAG: hypothetical protein KDA99_28275, partial [Planctomycetales bacterium]|nr:hypothetical protein [Planctomycetales bacterium]